MSRLIDSRLIGNTIRQLRLQRHLTQNELAETIGYSTRNLRRIETEGTTNIDVVNTFAEYFGVEALDILDGVSFCLLFILKNKKSIGDLHHTILTLICCSCTCTPG